MTRHYLTLDRLTLGMFILIMCLVLSACVKTQILGGPVAHDRLLDGVYEGRATGGPNSVAVRVTIENRHIAHIEILGHKHMSGQKAEPVIPQRIIEQQSTNVDAVSGATNSSKVIMNAVQNALEQAYN